MTIMKMKPATFAFTVFKYASIILASLVALLPICVCVLTAFKTTEEYNTTSVLDLPASFAYFENFVIAVQQANMFRGFMNTAPLWHPPSWPRTRCCGCSPRRKEESFCLPRKIRPARIFPSS